MTPTARRHLFVWRGAFFANQTCMLRCIVDRRLQTKAIDGIDGEHSDSQCPLCGWRSGYSITDNQNFWTDIIRAFDINSAELPLAELGTHLRHNFSDVRS
jgi:hypothetical protein